MEITHHNFKNDCNFIIKRFVNTTAGTSLFENKRKEIGAGIHQTIYKYLMIIIGVEASNQYSDQDFLSQLLFVKDCPS